MFEYICLDISKSNQENFKLRNQIESLKIELSNSKKSLSLMRLVSLINHDLDNEKDSAIQYSQKMSKYYKKLGSFPFQTTKIVNDQILHQCEKIIGGNLDEVVDIFRKVNPNQIFLLNLNLLMNKKVNSLVVEL